MPDYGDEKGFGPGPAAGHQGSGTLKQFNNPTNADPNLQVDVGAGNLGVEPPGFLEKFGTAAVGALNKYLGAGGIAGLAGKGIFSTLQDTFPDLEISTNPPQKPEGGDGPSNQLAQIVPPAFNPIEDMVGSEYVAYGGVGADQLRRQLFPYMNFNQPTQPGISGMVGQYASPGMGTGLMTGPFGMSNTQV
jgi:hypothetical protein